VRPDPRVLRIDWGRKRIVRWWVGGVLRRLPPHYSVPMLWKIYLCTQELWGSQVVWGTPPHPQRPWQAAGGWDFRDACQFLGTQAQTCASLQAPSCRLPQPARPSLPPNARGYHLPRLAWELPGPPSSSLPHLTPCSAPSPAHPPPSQAQQVPADPKVNFHIHVGTWSPCSSHW
jgi:hypothetical protein